MCTLQCTLRYNKYVKNLVRDVSHPEINLANSVTQDVAASYLTMVLKCDDEKTDPHHRCMLKGEKRNWFVTEDELFDLNYMGIGVDQLSVCCYEHAFILGVHFRAGEWDKSPRCGSVVTCVLDGQSCYARVERFLQIAHDTDCPGYASVRWFSKPSYPAGTPVVVRVNEDGSEIQQEYGNIIRLNQIDPSRVIVEYDVEPNTFYVMRDSGYDTIS